MNSNTTHATELVDALTAALMEAYPMRYDYAEREKLIRAAVTKVLAEHARSPLREEPTNLSAEPGYPNHPTVIMSMRRPGLTAHLPTERCAIQEPHETSECGEWAAAGPKENDATELVDRAALLEAFREEFPACSGITGSVRESVRRFLCAFPLATPSPEIAALERDFWNNDNRGFTDSDFTESFSLAEGLCEIVGEANACCTASFHEPNSTECIDCKQRISFRDRLIAWIKKFSPQIDGAAPESRNEDAPGSFPAKFAALTGVDLRTGIPLDSPAPTQKA